MSLLLTPVDFDTACRFVAMWHRHYEPPRGHKFSIGVQNDRIFDQQARDCLLVGVIIVGRPVARMLDNGQTLEVTRTATDGTPNANSMLYSAAWRAAKAMGYRRLVTYTEDGESGSSLRGAGWRVVAERPARPGWSVPSRPRNDSDYRSIPRTLWEAFP